MTTGLSRIHLLCLIAALGVACDSDSAQEPGVGTADGSVVVTATVANVGDREGTDVVQLYVEDDAVGVSLPARQLVGFEGVTLGPGQRARVEFSLDLPILAYTRADGRWIVEPGPVTIFVGPASDNLPLAETITVTGDTADVTTRRVYLTASRHRITDGL